MKINTVNIYIKTLGCKVNLFDSNVIASRLKELRLEGIDIDIVNDYKKAQCIIINTCSVTHNAEKEVFYLIRHYRKENPQVRIVLTGCAVSIDEVRQRLQQDYGIDLLVLNQDKSRFVSIFIPKLYSWINSIDQKLSIDNKELNLDGSNYHSDILFGEGLSDRQRYFLKIQDGCNAMCSYCIIPYTRGRARSVDEDLVIDQIKKIVDRGIKEIVLTGIHVGRYGTDRGSSLLNLLKKINQIKPYFRYRISSIEINELSDDLLSCLKDSPYFCPHFHIPMQSGSDKILSLMNRKYTRSEFKDRIFQIKSEFENVNIGTDIIVGFPTEDETDFKDSQNLIEDSGLNYLHVFPYSPRYGTRSYKMPDINQNEKVKRAKILRELSAKLYEAYLDQNIGTTAELLWETEHEACSKNYIHVLDDEKHLPGSVEMAVLKEKDPSCSTYLRI